MDNDQVTRPDTEDEIDLVALAKTIWTGRKTVLIAVIICTAIGLFVALFSPVEYTAQTVMVPQIQSKTSGLGGLSSLAAMAGFNLDAMQSGSSELSPMVYPQIVQSIPFQKEIMYTPLHWKAIAQPVNLIEYNEKYYKPSPMGVLMKYTIGLPGVILEAIRGDQPEVKLPGTPGDTLILLNKQEKKLRKSLSKQLTLTVNSKEGYLTLTGNAPEALIAAEMVQKAQEELQKKVTEFKIDKAKQNYSFIQGLYKEKEKEFAQAQQQLAQYRDRNQNLNSSLAKTEEEKLQSRYQLTFSVYNEIAKQLENAKIKVKEDTPIFSIIEPVSVPNEKSKPEKMKILAIWIFIGLVVGCGWIFGKKYLIEVKKKWNIVDH